MIKTTYKIYPFDSVQTQSGALVMMYQRSDEETITDAGKEVPNWTEKAGGTDTFGPNPSVGGVGIARLKNNNFIFTVGSKQHLFNNKGEALYTADIEEGWHLYMAVVQNAVTNTGTTVTADVEVENFTRATDGTITSTSSMEEGYEVEVSSLNVRDQFAIQALRGMLEHIDDPSNISDNEINFYCQMAYQWAANMMNAAAVARIVTIDNTGSSSTEPVEVGMLESNTDKLLNNIISALERTDYAKRLNPNSSNDAAEYEYYERVYQPDLINFLNTYVAHTPTSASDKVTKVGLDDLINAIKNLNTGGGGSSSSNITAYYKYEGIRDALADGWNYDTDLQEWTKTGYTPVHGDNTDAVAKTLPTFKRVNKGSVAEMPDLITAINNLTVEVKRIADKMTSN